MASLQDQLLGSGLINKKKASRMKAEKHQAIKKSRQNNTELANESVELAMKIREEQRIKSQKLNEQHRKEVEHKAIIAQIRQIIEINSIEKSKDENVIAYNFTDANKVKTLHLSQETHNLISRGRVAIAKLDDSYHLIPLKAASKISERDSDSIILLNANSTDIESSPVDDPYADFQIPDDLMW